MSQVPQPIRSENPDPKPSILKSLFEQENKELTYSSFNFAIYKEFRSKMEQYRRSCFGTNMESLWKSLRESYLPQPIEDLLIKAEWLIDTDGNAVPSRFFAEKGSDLDQLIEPLVAIKIHTGLSIVTQKTPDVYWDSDNELYQSRVRVLDAARHSDWNDKQTRQQYQMMWFYLFLFGGSFWRRIFDHEEREVNFVSEVDLVNNEMKFKKGKLVEVDQTVGEALTPLDVWIDPSTVPGMERTMRYARYDKVFDGQTFLKKFKGIVPAQRLNKVKPNCIEGYTGDDLFRCEYFEHRDLDLLYVVANDVPILKQHLPWNHKGLSIKMVIWTPRGDKNPFGLGPIEMMGPNKQIFDKLLKMTMNQVKFSIYKSLFYQGSLDIEGESGGDFKLQPDRAYKCSTNPKDIKTLEIPGPGSDAWKAIAESRARLDDASGINRPLGGEISKNTTAFEVDLAKDAALARLGLPINNVVDLLQWDAEITFELQKQHYSLPEITELVDPDDITAAVDELNKIKANPNIQATFSIWFDESNPENPRAFRGDFRTEQLTLETSPSGEEMSSLGKQQVVFTPEVFDWKGKIHVVADSILTITPTVERTRKMEFFNLIIPLFQSPPELVAKPARELAKLYHMDYEDVFPEHWLAYLKQVDGGQSTPEQAQNVMQQQQMMQQPGFQQQRAGKVVTNVN